MLSKSLVLAVAATGLMAGAAFAQSSINQVTANPLSNRDGTTANAVNGPQDNTLNPSANSWTPSASASSYSNSASSYSNQSNVSASVTDVDSSGNITTNELITNGPVPDTMANRAKFGGPDSHAGKSTQPRGN